MRKRIKVFFMMFLIIFSFFLIGCKNENDSIVDNGLYVKSSVEGGCQKSHYLVEYKTQKRFLDIGEDLNVSVSFGRTRDYDALSNVVFKSATAELLMKRTNQLTDYEEIDSQTLKIIDDFSLDEYKETFTSEKNVVNVTIPSQWFDNSSDSFVFSLRVTEKYLSDDVEIIYDQGAWVSLYYRIIGEQIKLYGSFYKFKNDNV